jgi:hypothetical protein
MRQRTFALVLSALALAIAFAFPRPVRAASDSEAGGRYNNCISIRSDNSIYNACNINLSLTVCQDATDECGVTDIRGNSSLDMNGEGTIHIQSGTHYEWYPCRFSWTAVDADNVPIIQRPREGLAGTPYRCVAYGA